MLSSSELLPIPYPPVDVVFITALEDELAPILKFTAKENWTEFNISRFPHYRAKIKFGDFNLSVVACSLPTFGSLETANAMHRLQILKPRAIVMTGICAGWEERDIQLGDVIVATKAFSSDTGKLTNEGLTPETTTFDPSPWLVKQLQSVGASTLWINDITVPRPRSLQYFGDLVLCAMTEDPTPFKKNSNIHKLIDNENIDGKAFYTWLQRKKYLNKQDRLTKQAKKRIEDLIFRNGGRLQAIPERTLPQVHYSSVASGQAVVAIDDPFSNLAQHVRTVRALEMEIDALYTMAHYFNHEVVFAVKGVSDYGTPPKDDTFREYAAEVSARWVYAFIRDKWNHIVPDYEDEHRSVVLITNSPLAPVHEDKHLLIAKIQNVLAKIDSNSIALQSHKAVLRDLEMIWSQSVRNITREQIESLDELPDLSHTFRLALIQSSITSSANNYSPRLTGAAVEHGIWSTEHAIKIIERLTDLEERADACVVILEHGVSTEECIRLHQIFFKALQGFSNYYPVVETLKRIAPLLDSSFVEEALTLTQSITDLSERARALAAVLPHLDENRKQILMREFMTRISLEEEHTFRSRALAAIASQLPNDLIDMAINIISELRSVGERSQTISALASQPLTDEQVQRLFRIAVSLQDGRERADSISALAAVLPSSLIAEALTFVQNVDEIHARSTASVDLYPRIEEEETKKEILDHMFRDLRDSNSTFTRSNFPSSWLYRKLPNNYQIEAIKLSFETGTLITSSSHRAEAYGLALYRLCLRNDKENYEEIFDRAFYELLQLAVFTCDSIAQVVPHLPEVYAKTAIETVLDVIGLPINHKDESEKRQDKIDRITWASRILSSPYLTKNQRETLLDIVWKITLSLPRQEDKLKAINPLVEHLTGRELRYLLLELSPISDYRSRADALGRIARQLSDSAQKEIVEKILTSYLPQIPTDRDKALAIIGIRNLLRGEQLQKCLEIVSQFEEEISVAIALANIAESVTSAPVNEIFNRALKMSDEEAKALIIEAISAKLTTEQITECMDFVISLSGFRQKKKILSSFATTPQFTREQANDCFSKVQNGKEKLINLGIAAALLPIMDPEVSNAFQDECVRTILSNPPTSAQFGIAWAASSIAPFLREDLKEKVMQYALHAVCTNSGNMSTYPGGNPKTKALIMLIPQLNPEMQQAALREVETIPNFGSISREDANPMCEVLEGIAADLEISLLPAAVEQLRNSNDNWSKVTALELIAGRLPETDWDQFISVAKQIETGWMRARVLTALSAKFPKRKITKLVQTALLIHLLETQTLTRKNLLSSVDVRLFKAPFMNEGDLKQIANHIIEVCDEWAWPFPS